MVEHKDIDITEKTLYQLGFKRNFPHTDATPKQIRFLNAHKKDRIYIHPNDGTVLELHWRLTEVDHPFKPTLQQLLASSSTIAVHNEHIKTVSGFHLWLYQCLHGSYSGWYRLRWICDIALLLETQTPDWSELLKQAERYHCSNSLLEAVGLACTIFELEVPDALLPLLEKKHSLIQRQMNRCAQHLSQMRLMKGVADVKRILFWAPAKSFMRYLSTHGPINANDFNRIKLPDSLFFAYYLLRPFSFLYFRLHITQKD